jgi:hypothetical protein
MPASCCTIAPFTGQRPSVGEIGSLDALLRVNPLLPVPVRALRHD